MVAQLLCQVWCKTSRCDDLRTTTRLTETDAKVGASIAAASSAIGVEEQGGNVQVLSVSVLTQPVEVSRAQWEDASPNAAVAVCLGLQGELRRQWFSCQHRLLLQL